MTEGKKVNEKTKHLWIEYNAPRWMNEMIFDLRCKVQELREENEALKCTNVELTAAVNENEQESSF